MASPVILFEALPAAYGDSLLVTCALKTGAWHLLVDTGTDECWPSLQARLAQLPKSSRGERRIDLAVISHIDHDHIGAAAALFGDTSLGLSFGDVWFNAPPPRTTRGVAEGASLSALLGGKAVKLPWNLAWHGAPAVTPANVPFVEVASKPGSPRITLLSPDPLSLSKLFSVWDKELQRLGQSESPEPAPGGMRGGALSIEALAAKATPTDRAPANGSSIALLLEHRGASVLLAADAHPTVLVPALEALAAHRGLALPLQVDVFKLSHHGSRANVTAALLETVQAKHYVVSTNGAIFGHPDEEAMARVITKGGSQRKIWFNYLNEHTARWADPALQERYGYSAVVPKAAAAAVTIAMEEPRS